MTPFQYTGYTALHKTTKTKISDLRRLEYHISSQIPYFAKGVWKCVLNLNVWFTNHIGFILNSSYKDLYTSEYPNFSYSIWYMTVTDNLTSQSRLVHHSSSRGFRLYPIWYMMVTCKLQRADMVLNRGQWKPMTKGSPRATNSRDSIYLVFSYVIWYHML